MSHELTVVVSSTVRSMVRGCELVTVLGELVEIFETTAAFITGMGVSLNIS
jgi:hypothetical protein